MTFPLNKTLDKRHGLSQQPTEQFWMFVQGTFFKEFFFRKNIGNFIDLQSWK